MQHPMALDLSITIRWVSTAIIAQYYCTSKIVITYLKHLNSTIANNIF